MPQTDQISRPIAFFCSGVAMNPYSFQRINCVQRRILPRVQFGYLHSLGLSSKRIYDVSKRGDSSGGTSHSRRSHRYAFSSLRSGSVTMTTFRNFGSDKDDNPIFVISPYTENRLDRSLNSTPNGTFRESSARGIGARGKETSHSGKDTMIYRASEQRSASIDGGIQLNAVPLKTGKVLVDTESVSTDTASSEPTTKMQSNVTDTSSESSSKNGKTSSALKSEQVKPSKGRAKNEKEWGPFNSHEELIETLLSLEGDPLEADGGRIVTFRGYNQAELMVIGEGPGADEDKVGLPFVGKSGQLLDRIFKYAGFDVQKHIYVTNVVRRRPKNNRKPTMSEIRYYRGLLMEEIRLVKPKMIILAGQTAVQGVLEITMPIGKMRGAWHSWGGRQVMPIFHPSYILRQESMKLPLGDPSNAKSLMKIDILEIRKKYLELVEGAELGEIRPQKQSGN